MFKPIYFDAQTAPVKFLKVFRCLLVIAFVLRLAAMPAVFAGGNSALYIIENLVEMAALLIAAIGLFRMKWFGVIAYAAGTAATCVFALISLARNFAAADSSGIGSSVGVILGTLIVFIPVMSYLCHRRPLFSPDSGR